MTAPRHWLVLLCSTLVLGAAGCGGSGDMASDDAAGSNGDNSLAESDIARVLDARRIIDAACGSDGSGSPEAAGAPLGDAISDIASITEEYPDRVYETGNEDRAEQMTTVSERVSVQLRRCGIPVEADRLAEIVESRS